MGSLLLLIVASAPSCGTEVGNGARKKQPTTIGAGEGADKNNTETPESNTDTAATNTSSSKTATMPTAWDVSAMRFLLAECGSPFADKISGTFLKSAAEGGDSFFSATAASADLTNVTFMNQYEYSITPRSEQGNDVGPISVVSSNPESMPQATYTCANATRVANITYQAITGVTKGSVDVNSGSSTASVAWYLRPLTSGSVTPEVYRIEVTIDATTAVYERSSSQ